MNIHPTAIIEDGAQIHESVEIGPYAYIGNRAKIGENCWVGHHATVEGNTTLGSRNKIHPYAYIGGKTQDLKYKGGDPELIIGDDNTFREYATAHCGTTDEIPTKVGHKNLFLAYTHIAHECQIGDENICSNGIQLAGHVEIGNKTVIGGLSGVHQFVKIGSYAMCGGGTIMVKDVPPFMMVQGNHATLVNINKIGMERSGFTQEDIEDAFRAFKIFRRGHTFKRIPMYLEQNLNPEGTVCKMLVEFVQNSERGIVGFKK